MALGTDVNELNEAPGSGVLDGNIRVPVKLPGSARGVLHNAPLSRLPGAGTGSGTVQAISIGGTLYQPDSVGTITLLARDLLALTPAFMNSVMGLTYTSCDADPTSSPAGSYPGQEFDAIDPADNGNYHYYCRRGTYVPGNTSTGPGPAWHRVAKV